MYDVLKLVESQDGGIINLNGMNRAAELPIDFMPSSHPSDMRA